jgi:Flp pilus assembly pilin Flp
MLTYNKQRNITQTLHGEENTTMNRFKNFVLRAQLWKDVKGQDLIEYALMAGFVAVAAGAIMPGVATSVSTIFSLSLIHI